jgi:hypothetical protein
MEPIVQKAPSLEATLKAEAARFTAEEAANAAKNAPPPPAEPGVASEGADAAATASLVVTLLNLALTQMLGAKFAQSPAETALLTAKAEPVIKLYFPPELFLGPAGALAMTAVAIYLPKFMAEDPPTQPATETVDSTATEVKQ